MKRVKNSIGLVINTDNSKVNYNLIEENKKLKLRIEELEKQLTLTDVVKSFYCYDKTVANAEEDYDFKQCDKQCEKCMQ